MDPAIATIAVAVCSAVAAVVVALVRLAAALAVSSQTSRDEHSAAFGSLAKIEGKLDTMDERIEAHLYWHLDDKKAG